MSRPTQKVTGSKLSLEVPAGWHVVFAAISRKDYNQVIKVYNTIDRENNHLASEHGQVLETMKDLANGEDSLAIRANRKPMRLDFEWFYSETTIATDHSRAALAIPANKSEVIQVRSVPKPPKAPASIPDFITFMIFVADALGRGADQGIYHDGVATIHCVKQVDNAQDDDSEEE